MLELSDIQSSPEELQDYYAQLQAQHVTPAWICLLYTSDAADE